MYNTAVVAPRLQTLDDYRAERSHIYPSGESLRWFIRQNRDELAEAGALSLPTGRLLIEPDAFDRTVQSIGSRRARRS